jgi:hypothetical protein
MASEGNVLYILDFSIGRVRVVTVTSWETDPGHPTPSWIRDWLGTRTGRIMMEKRIFLFLPGTEPRACQRFDFPWYPVYSCQITFKFVHKFNKE